MSEPHWTPPATPSSPPSWTGSVRHSPSVSVRGPRNSSPTVPPSLPDNSTTPRPNGFGRLEKEDVIDLWQRSGVHTAVVRVYSQMRTVTVGPNEPPPALLAPVHSERVDYFRWLREQRGNPWLTFEEVNDVLDWHGCPSLGLIHERDLVAILVTRLLRVRLPHGSPPRWQRRLGQTRLFNVSVVVRELRLAAAMVAMLKGRVDMGLGCGCAVSRRGFFMRAIQSQ